MTSLTVRFTTRWPQVRILQSSVLWCTLILALSAEAYDDLALGVPNFKPYTYLENKKITGSAISPVKKAMAHMKVKADYRLYETYTDLLRALKRGDIQGFFLASKNAERDSYAEFSEPITLNNWTWFTLKENQKNIKSDAFKRHDLIGTIKKTNTFRWLTRNGYQVRADDIEALPKLLVTGKVDAVFAAEAVFEKSCEEEKVPTTLFRKNIEIGKPFGIYMSKEYLRENAGFMKKLNRYITKQIFTPSKK